MRLLVSPPPFADIMRSVFNGDDPDRGMKVVTSGLGPVDSRGRYLHWDKLRHLDAPNGLTSEEYWLAVKMGRKANYRSVPFRCKNGHQFQYMMPDPLWQKMLWIEGNAGGLLASDQEPLRPKAGQRYLVRSLVEEAITSSQLEGAATTRRVAKEMLETGRRPKNTSELMIYNNYKAMQFVKDYKDDDLTPSIVMELHKILTEGTMDPEDVGLEGHFRRQEDDICVFSADEVLLHAPPHADQLPQRLKDLCDFANAEQDPFIPPLVKAIILHFMIGYDHPFVDGNGRTARALFYWYAARKGYWLMEYVSISRVLKAAPSKYMQAYLATESDENDLTYFIEHQIGVIKRAIEDLKSYIDHKQQEVQEVEAILRKTQRGQALNHRQIKLLQHAVRNPGDNYTIRRHQNSHGVAYQTARTDLLYLADELDLLLKLKRGNRDIFIAPNDLGERLNQL